MAPHQKGARQRGDTLVFHDESGFSLKPSVRRTWAPRGQTPIIKHRFNWKRLNCLGNLACRADGKECRLLLCWQEPSVKDVHILAHLEALPQEIGAPITLLWDGLPAHRSGAVQEYLAANRDWLTVERFPAYAPELNPLEYLHAALKGKDLANYCPDTTLELEQQLVSGKQRIGGDQALLYSFLVASGLYEKRTDCSSP